MKTSSHLTRHERPMETPNLGLRGQTAFAPHLDQTYIFDKNSKGSKNILHELDNNFNAINPSWLFFQSIPNELKDS